MRALGICAAMALAGLGCKDKKKAEGSAAAVDLPPAGAPAPTADAGEDMAGEQSAATSFGDPGVPSNQLLRSGREHMAAGRYREAMRDFQRAVRDSELLQAYNELAFAAFKAGDLEESLRASSVLDDEDGHPRLAGPAFYNRGLALEAQGKKEEARLAFARSFAARPTGAAHRAWKRTGGPSATPLPCADAYRAEAELLACLDDGDEHGEGSYLSVVSADIRAAKRDFSIVERSEEDGHEFGESRFFLVHRSASGYRVVGDIGATSFGAFKRMTAIIEAVEDVVVGGRELVRIETSLAPAADAEEEHRALTATRQVTFCTGGGEPSCSPPVHLARTWTPPYGWEDSMTGGESWSASARATEEGIVVRSDSGLRDFRVVLPLPLKSSK